MRTAQYAPMQAHRPLKHRLLASLIAAPLALLGGCHTITPATPASFKVYEQEQFLANAPHVRSYAVNPAQACLAVRRVLLGQGYMLTVEESAKLHGRKYFRPSNGTGVELAIQVSCLPEQRAEHHSQVFVTAWQDEFVTKRNPVAASVGAPVLGNLSMPVAMTDEALVKIGVETVFDVSFYQRFFALVGAQLAPQ